MERTFPCSNYLSSTHWGNLNVFFCKIYLSRTVPPTTEEFSKFLAINSFQIAKFMYCYHNNLLPPLFFNLFFTNSQIHGYSTRTANNYRVHHCRTNLKKFTILYQGPKIWNSLPVTITSLSSFPNFKKILLEFLVK